MFSISSTMIGALILAIGITLKKYILGKLNKNGTLANVIYVTLLICLVFPLYLWQFKFTFTSLNDTTAKRLVDKVLEFKILKGYKSDTLDWKPYGLKKDIYNIKATIYDKNNTPYNLYLQPTCKFFKGCKVGIDRIVVIEPTLKNIPIDKMDEKMFDKRVCEDKIARDLLISTNVKPFFKLLFEKYNSIANSQATYRIDSVKLHNFKQTKPTVKVVEKDGYKLSNSCSAVLYIKGDFKIVNKGYDFTDRIVNSMFDEVKKEKSGYLIKTKINYNVYIDPKKGAIRLNSMFVDLKKMKKFQAAIKSKLQKKKRANSNCAFDIKFPKDMVVLAGGNYGGKKTNIQIDQSGHVATEFDVSVNYPGKNVALFLSAYEPSIWHIKWTKNTKIVAVYVSGYYKQIVLGVPKSTPILNSTYKNHGKCGYFNISNKNIEQANQISKRVFGKNIKIVYLAKRDGKVVFGKEVSSKHLISSNDYKLSQFIDKSKPLAGQMGLKDLEKKGYIRTYTKEDIQKWVELQKRIYRKKDNLKLPKVINGDVEKSFKPRYILHGYTILKEITIPKGLYGGNAATFFLLKGVPFPKGDLGHSTLYDFNTGKCYGVMCKVR
ncbi:MAG: hypothetical protein GXO12_04990 [Epsilonproteobacteria bacterium]|nr:hypothetical protein [Campylobacterota bacterium]